MALWKCLRVGRSLCSHTIKSTRLTLSTRAMSSTNNMVIDMDTQKGVATVKLNKKPVNSLNLEFLDEIVSTIDSLEKDEGCRGVILTSNNAGVFSAGLDILEMYQPDETRLRQFWSNVQEMWIRLYGTSLITMSAINGHSPAGGCLIALATDYRIMAGGKYTIGLNETLLGILVPTWLQLTMANTIGHRQTERAVQLGHLYGGEEALQVGLIDRLVPEDDVMSTTMAEMDKWLRIPDIARKTSKLQLRQATLDHLLPRREEDTDFFVNFIMKSSIQKFIGIYLEALKKKPTK